MKMTPEWLGFLREQYPPGTRIKLGEMKDPHSPVEPGTVGTLDSIDDIGTFHVRWDNGRTLGLVVGEDSFSMLPPALKELRLYMPLTASHYTYNGYGDMENESEALDGRELLPYEGQILAALMKNRLPVEKERGVMHWHGEKDAIDQKVHSAQFSVEARDGRLWGVAECQVSGQLTPEELGTLKEFIAGQASDGWGEDFEQQEIQADGSALYVHLWNSNDWSIQTEEECFSPQLAEGLPELCFSVLPGTGKLICIKRGESGYFPSDWDTGDPAQNRELADYNNQKLGVTKAQEEAMLSGSMAGWDCPGADPAWYEEHGQQMGGMTFEQT